MSVNLESVLQRYISDKDEKTLSADKGFIYNFGPYMVMNTQYSNLVNSIANLDSDMALMVYGSTIFKNTKSTPKKIKAIAREAMLSFINRPCNKPETYVKAVESYTKELIESLTKYQYENKILESAMISYSPIVPYDSTINKEWLKDKEIQLPYKPNNGNYSESILQKIINKADNDSYRDILHNLLLTSLYYILADYNKTLYDVSNDRVPILADKLIISRNGNTKEEEVNTYYFLAYCLYSNISKKSTIDYLTNIKNIYTGESDMYSIIESMKYDYIPADEIWDTMDLDNVSRWKIEELADVDKLASEYERTFDIQRLLSFITNNTTILCDEYTNRTFITNVSGEYKVTDISYYQDGIMSAVINDKYTVIPYIDIADNWKTRYLIMDKDGNIFHRNLLEFE